MALFIIVPEEKVSYYKSLTALLFQDLFGIAMKPQVKGKPYRPILFLLEEAANVGVLEGNFSEILTTIRKRQVGISIILQSVSQLYNAVGKQKAEVILANCLTKLYLSGLDMPTSELLARQFGRTTVQYLDIKEEIREGVRELMTVDDIMTIPENTGILVHKNLRPLITPVQSAYQQSTLMRRMQRVAYVNLPKIPSKIPEISIPRIRSKSKEPIAK
jgi:type IV secretory pathway TraG/TraD family ATPase VirD4